ncbi:hypothetical protein KIF24_02555 [Micromonospora sp. Llam7]|uniref:hypothetical protein n=1 Tax=Micromonospora tarapacensis TaxID=2835305 RepID=UPI001C8336E4|nr:hypothetical protein [Micromonospora tarapacensis]MBX7265046.1 hypothetical protein [Micromonospora tarapacensis]
MESGCGRRTARLWWTLPLLLAVLSVPLVPAAAASAAPEETGRYYVVGPPVDGQREYLYSIALVTLGNGNRFREIIDLNRGRRQPDGATFTDGVELGPGWILVLPTDADGPGVRTGALPAIGPPTPRPTPPRSPSASAPPRARRRRPEHGGAVAERHDPAAAVERGPLASGGRPGDPGRRRPGPESSGLAGLSPNLIRIGAGGLAVLLAVVALLVLPRRMHQRRSVGLDDGPWPPERHHTPTPAELEADVPATPSTSPPAPADDLPPAPPGSPVSRPPADWPPWPTPRRRRYLLSRWQGTSRPTRRATAVRRKPVTCPGRSCRSTATCRTSGPRCAPGPARSWCG